MWNIWCNNKVNNSKISIYRICFQALKENSNRGCFLYIKYFILKYGTDTHIHILTYWKQIVAILLSKAKSTVIETSDLITIEVAFKVACSACWNHVDFNKTCVYINPLLAYFYRWVYWEFKRFLTSVISKYMFSEKWILISIFVHNCTFLPLCFVFKRKWAAAALKKSL